jgi:hypothetical protein
MLWQLFRLFDVVPLLSLLIFFSLNCDLLFSPLFRLMNCSETPTVTTNRLALLHLLSTDSEVWNSSNEGRRCSFFFCISDVNFIETIELWNCLFRNSASKSKSKSKQNWIILKENCFEILSFSLTNTLLRLNWMFFHSLCETSNNAVCL